jgi:hypothetical protein
MDSDSTTFGLSRVKIARIMQIGCERDVEQSPSVPEDAAGLLQDWLSQPFSYDHGLNIYASDLSQIPCQPPALLRTKTVGDVLGDQRTTTSVLKRLKALGKGLSAKEGDPARRDVGLTLYYGAIANALVFHGVRITRLSLAELRRSFALLAGKEWMPLGLRSLFQEACERCASEGSP